MESMYLLIPLSLMLFVVGIWAVRFAVRSNQFEDLDNASQRVILDDRQERRQALNAKTEVKTQTEAQIKTQDKTNQRNIKEQNLNSDSPYSDIS